MDKDIHVGIFYLQSDMTWNTETAGTYSLDKNDSQDSGAIDMTQTQGILQVQVSHASDGAATLKVEVLESVDGVTFVLNASALVAALAKATPAIYNHDAKANRFVKIRITENNVADTVVTLSMATK